MRTNKKAKQMIKLAKAKKGGLIAKDIAKGTDYKLNTMKGYLAGTKDFPPVALFKVCEFLGLDFDVMAKIMEEDL